MDFSSAAAGEDRCNSLGNGEKLLERHLVEKPHVVAKPCDELLSGGTELGWRNQQLVQERRMGGRMEVMVVLRSGRCEGEKGTHECGASEKSLDP